MYDEEEPYREKRILPYILIGWGVVLLLVTGLVLARSGSGPSRAGFGFGSALDGDTCSHEELLAYLRANGLQFDEHPTGTMFLPSMFLDRLQPRGRYPAAIALAFQAGNLADAVRVTKHESAQAAKDRASVLGGFSWGRFVFEGDRKFMEDIRSVLP